MRPEWQELPAWLADPVAAVLDDIQGDDPIPGLRLCVLELDHPDALVLGVVDADGTGGGAGGTVSPAIERVQMLLTIAEILQEECAETAGGWGQARPGCPYHPHPARPALRDGEAWWVCERRDEALYRIGAGEASATARARHGRKPPSWP